MKMKHLIIFSCLTLLFLLPCTAFAESSPMNEATILSVDGEGVSQDIPNQAIVTISVITEADTAEKTRSENAEKAHAILLAINNMEIPKSDVQTSGYSFQPIHSYDSNRKSSISGYRADNTISVTVNNLDIIGQVVDTALSCGANSISSLDYVVKNTEKLRKEALLKAIKDAQNKANIIANGLGKRITGIKSVSENTGNPVHRAVNMAMLSKGDNNIERTPLEAGTVSISASVHIDFILNN